MEIISVKIQGSSWLLNNVMHVPGNADGNIEYELIKVWIAEGNEPEAEFTEVELEAQLQEQANAEARAYLQSTDWYVTRFTETGKEIPEEVKTKRDEARLQIK